MKTNWAAAVLLALMPGLCFAVETSTTVIKPAAAAQLNLGKAVPQSGAVAVSTRTYIDKLKDPDANVRKEAILYLGMEKKQKNLPYLQKMLKDLDNNVRRVAIDACMRTGTAKIIGPAILEMLKSEKEVGATNAAIDALGRIKYVEALPEITKRLAHQFPTVRTYAIKALGEYNDPQTYPLVIEKLLDPAEGVRFEAMKVVSKLKIEPAEPNLIENLKYPMGAIRREAARALGEVGSRAVITELEKLKTDKDRSVAAAAASAIENINKTK